LYLLSKTALWNILKPKKNEVEYEQNRERGSAAQIQVMSIVFSQTTDRVNLVGI